MDGIEVVLVLLDFDGDGRDIVVELMVACNFVGQAPVVRVSHSLL